jgi:predicted Zn-dependent protease
VTRQRALRAIGVAICVVGAGASLLAYRSERRFDQLQRSTFTAIGTDPRQDPRAESARQRALGLISSARLLNPDSRIDVQQALFLELETPAAEAVLRKATRREPENVYLWISWAKRRESAGDLAGARRAYARAVVLDPRLPR